MAQFYRTQPDTGLLDTLPRVKQARLRLRLRQRPARVTPQQTARRPALRMHTWVMSGAALLDLVALLVLSGGAASAGRYFLPGVSGHGRGLLIALGMAAGAGCASGISLYNAKRFINLLGACARGVMPLAASFAAIAAALWDIGASPAHIAGSLLPIFLLGITYVGVSRFAWRHLLLRGLHQGNLCYRLVVIGTEASSVTFRLQQLGSPFIHIDSMPHHEGSLRLANSRARRHCLDAIILAYHPSEAKLLHASFETLKQSVPDILVYSSIARCSAFPDSHPLCQYPVAPIQRAALRERDIFAKGLVDRIGSLLLILALSPVLAAAALAIKAESRGPVLFRQPRVGYNNRLFMMYKFRSMYHEQRDAKARTQTTRNDRRVTRVGRFIRKYSVDELPQLFNVLRGDMSLVGPRPHAPGTNVDGVLLSQASEEYVLRHRVSPGITGWAQVNGSRGVLVRPEDIARRVSLDLDYIENWSLGLDLKILLLTVLRVTKTSEAF